jgi:hypothetical protein
MTIEEFLISNGMVEFGFENSIEPNDEWKKIYTINMDWDLDRLIICCIILLLKKHLDYNEGVCEYCLNDIFLIYRDRLYIKNVWAAERFVEICANIRGMIMVMREIDEFIPGSNMSYLLDGLMGVEV